MLLKLNFRLKKIPVRIISSAIKLSHFQFCTKTSTDELNANNLKQKNFDKNENNNNVYYPIKRINFTNKTEYPIYTLDQTHVDLQKKSIKYSLWNLFFGGYLLNWIFFFDLKNFWHLIPLSFSFYYGVKGMFTQRNLMNYHAKQIYLKDDGENLIIILPFSALTRKLNENIVLKDYPEIDINDIKFQVKISEIGEIGFLSNFMTESEENKDKPPKYDDPNLIILNPKKKKDAEKAKEKENEVKKKEDAEEMSQKNIDNDNDDDEDDDDGEDPIIMHISKDEEIFPIIVQLNCNKNSAYNDYLIAIAQKKKLILRQTKEKDDKNNSKDKVKPDSKS